MHVLGAYMAWVTLFPSGMNSYEVTCGQDFTAGRFASSVSTLVAQGEGIKNELSKCPDDKVLVKLSFLSSLKERRCEEASVLWSRFEGKGYWRPSEYAPDNLAICFYDLGDYGAAVERFSKIQSIVSGGADILTRHIYAESLHGIGKTDAAIHVLKSVAKIDYHSIENPAEKISYLQSLVSLSRILYSADMLEESAKYSARAVEMEPDNVDAHEVLLASSAKAEKLEGIDLRKVYCDAARLKIDEIGNSSGEASEDLKNVRARISRENAVPVSCPD